VAIGIYQAKSGRCTEHALLALFYWLLYLYRRHKQITCEIYTFAVPFDHDFLLLTDRLNHCHYVCDPWLDIVVCVEKENFEKVLRDMQIKLCRNLKDECTKGELIGNPESYQDLFEMQRILENGEISKITLFKKYHHQEKQILFLQKIVAEFIRKKINVNHPTFHQLHLHALAQPFILS
jgi:hypothetical protein